MIIALAVIVGIVVGIVIGVVGVYLLIQHVFQNTGWRQ